MEKLISNFRWKDKRPRITNSILKQKNKVRRLILCGFKNCRDGDSVKEQTDSWSRQGSTE
jgi:hypothetical protein